MATIKFDTKGLKKLQRRLGKDYPRLIKDKMSEFGDSLLKAVKNNIPVLTGKLKNSLKKIKVGGLSWGVKEEPFYGGILRAGSPPHLIMPNKKKALFWPGLAHPVARVNHPGFKARPYPKQALDQAQSEVSRELGDFGKEIVK